MGCPLSEKHLGEWKCSLKLPDQNHHLRERMNIKNPETPSQADQRKLGISVSDSTLRFSFPTGEINTDPKPRGKVWEYSRKSSARHYQVFKDVDLEAMGLPLFLTTTYAGRCPFSWEYKRHLELLIQRINRKFNNPFLTWRLEFQEERFTSGKSWHPVAHFHLLVFGVPFLDHQWLSEAWGEIVGTEFWDHSGSVPREPFTRVERAKIAHGVVSYVHKYVTKSGGSSKLCVKFANSQNLTPLTKNGDKGAAVRLARASARPPFTIGLTHRPYLLAALSAMKRLTDNPRRFWGVRNREKGVFLPKTEIQREIGTNPLPTIMLSVVFGLAQDSCRQEQKKLPFVLEFYDVDYVSEKFKRLSWHYYLSDDQDRLWCMQNL